MKKISFFAILTSGLLFASCAGEEIPGYTDSDLNDTPPAVEEPAPDNDNPVTERTPIEFEIPASVLTKTVLDLEDGMTVNWQDGDKVGIFYRYTPEGGSATIAKAACNVPYEYDAETGKFVAVNTPAYWDEGAEGTDHYLYVYYPYNEASTSYAAIAGKLAVAQTYDATAAQNAVASYGCFTGRASNIKYGKPVSFNALYHQFAMTRLNFTNNTGKDIVISTAEITSSKSSISGDIIIKMSKLNDYGVWPLESGGSGKTITVNVENGQVAAGGSIDIRFLQLTGNFASSDFTVKVTTTENEEYTFGYSGKGAVNGGQRIAKNINFVSPYAIKAVVDGGVLFKIDGDNAGGLVLFPKAMFLRTGQNEDGTYVTEQKVALIDTDNLDITGLSASADDGAVNVALLKEVDPTLEKCPAIKACEDLGSRIEGNWYVPAENEMKTLLGVYNGTDWYVTSRHQTKKDGIITIHITQEEHEARTGFDAFLKSLTTKDDIDADGTEDKGNAINYSYTSYGTIIWSSTWTSETQGIAFTPSSLATKSQNLNTSGTTYTRCIKKVKF